MDQFIVKEMKRKLLRVGVSICKDNLRINKNKAILNC